jgi:hypothetical protein
VCEHDPCDVFARITIDDLDVHTCRCLTSDLVDAVDVQVAIDKDSRRGHPLDLLTASVISMFWAEPMAHCHEGNTLGQWEGPMMWRLRLRDWSLGTSYGAP